MKTFYVNVDRGWVDGCHWLGTWLHSVEAETKEEAARLVALATGKEVLMVRG